MIGPVARISRSYAKTALQTSVRNHSHGGVPGENLPFNIHNKARLTLNFFWFVGTGLAAPFLVVWHQLAKK